MSHTRPSVSAQEGHLAWPPRSQGTSDLHPVVTSDEVIPTGTAKYSSSTP